MNANLNGITAADLEGYKTVENGEKPEGVTVNGCRLMVESDNTLRLYLSFNDVNPEEFTFTIDGAAATLKEGDSGKYLATKSGIYSNKLQVNHVYGISKDGKTYTLTTSVLTYVWAALRDSSTASENPNLVQLVKTLYLYNQAAIACFGR